MAIGTYVGNSQNTAALQYAVNMESHRVVIIAFLKLRLNCPLMIIWLNGRELTPDSIIGLIYNFLKLFFETFYVQSGKFSHLKRQPAENIVFTSGIELPTCFYLNGRPRWKNVLEKLFYLETNSDFICH